MDRLKYLEDRKDALLLALEKAVDDTQWQIDLQSDLKEVQDEIDYLNHDDDSDEEYEKLVDDRANLN